MTEILKASIVALSLAASVPSCKIIEEEEKNDLTTIIGTVSDERFTPKYSDSFVGSRYSFAIDTDNDGRKAIEVVETRDGPGHESVEVLLREGAIVAIEIPVSTIRNQIIAVTADQIKLIQQQVN